MILKRIRVKNFRSIRDISVSLGAHTAILGGNGAGKSTILRAIEKFYSTSSGIELDDFFDRKTDKPIEIALTFYLFNSDEIDRFGERIQNDEMTVVRVFEVFGGKGNGRYYGATNQFPPFYEIRQATGAVEKRQKYNSLRETADIYGSLAQVGRADEIEAQLLAWERAHQDRCTLMPDDGQFFGFANVGRGSLQKSTSFVFIPAVRDAMADAVDAKGAVVARLMELVVRSAVQQRSEIKQWQSKIGEEYRELTSPEKLHELGSLSTDLSATLRRFYADSAVILKWRAPEEFSIPLPSADVFLEDDGFEGPVDRKGHGLQRAFILTLLQHLAKSSAAAMETQDQSDADKKKGNESVSDQGEKIGGGDFILPGLILAIEEPELYQHPTKQRHFAKVLQQLSDGTLPGVAAQTQVIFASHSSLFVSIGRFDEVRIARRIQRPDADHKECILTSSTLAAVARRLESSFIEPEGTYTPEGLRSRLHVLGPELAEGFFAELVVLVEGASDRAALLAAGILDGFDFEANGIAVLPAGGKTGLSKPAAVFSELGIPIFIIWDCDKGGKDPKPEHNFALQRISGVGKDSLFEYERKIESNFAAFEVDLETCVAAELGKPIFDAQVDAARERYGLQGRKEVCKSPLAMTDVLTDSGAAGARSTMLSQIISAIRSLREAQNQQLPNTTDGSAV